MKLRRLRPFGIVKKGMRIVATVVFSITILILGFIYEAESSGLGAKGGLLVSADQVKSLDSSCKSAGATTTQVDLTLKEVVRGHVIGGRIGWPINSAEGSGILMLSSGPSPNLSKGAIWRAVEKDALDNNKIIVSGKQRVFSAVADTLYEVIIQSLGINPYSSLDHLKIGSNDSAMVDHYLKDELIKSFFLPAEIKMKVSSADLITVKKVLAMEINKWAISPKLRDQLIREVAQLNKGEDLDAFLKKGVEYKVVSWSVYRIDCRVPDVEISFGEKIGTEHYIQWSIGIMDDKRKIITLLDSARSPLVAQVPLAEGDSTAAIQVWGGKYPVSTRADLEFNVVSDQSLEEARAIAKSAGKFGEDLAAREKGEALRAAEDARQKAEARRRAEEDAVRKKEGERLRCEDNCRELFYKGQLRKGVSIDECIRASCR